MKILYGVVGEGMGHATRSRVVIEHLASLGHEILVVVSGRAHGFLVEKFRGNRHVEIREIFGLHLAIRDEELDVIASIVTNLKGAPRSLLANLATYEQHLKGFLADAVISDFESVAYLYARAHDIPVVSIDNMQILNRCVVDDELREGAEAAFRVAKLAVKSKLPGAYHYLVTGFFFPEVRKERTTLIPPILRSVVLNAKRHPTNHVLVYQTASSKTPLIPLLERLGLEVRVYGSERTGTDGNILYRPFSEKDFIHDLAYAKCVIASAGFSLMSEAISLRVPMFAMPIDNQFEQLFNARAIKKLGFGDYAVNPDDDAVNGFLSQIGNYQAALDAYAMPHSNDMLFANLSELLRDISVDEPAPRTLESPSMGNIDGA